MENKELTRLRITIFNLKNKKYEYQFDIASSFFENFEDSLIEKGDLNVEVSLNKSETFIELNIKITGTIELICDRSLDPFDKEIDIKEQLIFKYGEEEMELDDHMFQITTNTEYIDLRQFIYEFISLSIPMKKLHPRYQEDENDLDEYGTFIYTSSGEEDISDDEEESQEDNVDPRWQKLNELKNKNLNN